jgi:hypothetical protein
MFEQFFLGLALIGCLVLVYRLLRPSRVESCHATACGCEETDALEAIARRQEKGKGVSPR